MVFMASTEKDSRKIKSLHPIQVIKANMQVTVYDPITENEFDKC